MSKKSNVKVKIKYSGDIRKEIDDTPLAGLFNQMLGVGVGDPRIIVPKFKTFTDCINELCRIYDILSSENSIFIKMFPEQKENVVGIKDFIANAKSDLQKFTLDPATIERAMKFINSSMITPDLKICNDVVEIDEKYKKFKDCPTIVYILKQCSILMNYKIDIEKKSDEFIRKDAGSNAIYLIPNCSVNFMWVWFNDRMNPKMRQILMDIFFAIYTISYRLYESYIKPDIDIKEFSVLIVDKISQLEKVPELARCRDAFEKIKNGVGLLEGNFGQYYKNFKETKNPVVFVENYIMDLSSEEKANPVLIKQFQTLLNYYKKIQNSQDVKNNSQINKLVKSLDDKINMFNKNTGNSVDKIDLDADSKEK